MNRRNLPILHYTIAVLFTFLCTASNAQVFWQDDFENASTPDIPASSTRTASNNGGSGGPPNTSYFKRTTGSDISVATTSFSSFSNTYFWAGEDHDTPFGASGAEQQIEWTGINISGKSSITFSGLFGANSTNGSWDNFNTGSGATGFGIFTPPSASNDYIMVEYAVDAGAYVKLISFFGDDIIGPVGSAKKLKEDTNNDFIGDGTALNQAMAEFTKSISVSGSTMKIRIRVYSNGGSEEWAIDNFRLSTPLTSTTWNGSSWSNGNPSSTTDAIIASSTAPSSFTCKSLTINTGVALTTTSITATVNGDITNNGNGLQGNGNIVIASNASLLGTAISFAGNLSVSTGATLTTNSKLTLTSDATNTGSIGNSAGSISGNVTVQRYIPSGRRVFRFLSHPFSSNLAMNSLTDNIDITGSGGSPFTTTTTNSPSAFSYDNTNANSSLTNDPGWTALTAANTLNTKTGYRILIRGSKGQTGSLTGGTYTPNAVTIDWSGTLNQGNQVYTLLNNGANKAYSLISNPYAAPVDLSLLTRGSSINANFSVWNAQVSTKGAYITQAFSSPYILPSGAAFFAQTSANTNNTITFTEASKSTSSPVSIFRNNNSNESKLIIQVNDSIGNYVDKIEFIFSNTNRNYTIQYDMLWDAEKLYNPDVNFYSISADNKKLAIDRRPLNKNDTLLIGFTTASYTNFNLIVKELPVMQNGQFFLLRDKWLNKTYPLTLNQTIDISTVSNAQSQGNNRFEIVSAIQKTFNSITNSISVFPNPCTESLNLNVNSITTPISYTIFKVDGTKVTEGIITQSLTSIITKNLTSGIYQIRLNTGETISFIKQ